MKTRNADLFYYMQPEPSLTSADRKYAYFFVDDNDLKAAYIHVSTFSHFRDAALHFLKSDFITKSAHTTMAARCIKCIRGVSLACRAVYSLLWRDARASEQLCVPLLVERLNAKYSIADLILPFG